MNADHEVLASLLAAHAEVVKPDGPGPFPVVVQMHGCAGIQPMQRRYAQAARDAGVAAVIVDSLAPRGITRRAAHLTVCTAVQLRGAERAGDLAMVLDWLATQPWADMSRTAAAGWSHGGWSVMEALVPSAGGAPRSPRVAGLKLAVLVYPYAGVLSRTARQGWGGLRPRVAACIAGRDRVVGRLGPRRAMDRLIADGLEVEVLQHPHATHCFDDDCASDPRTVYDRELELATRDLYVRSLRAALLSGAGDRLPDGLAEQPQVA